MGRVATLEPARDSAKNRWYVSLPPRLSPTGKRKREYFASRREAQDRAKRAKQQLEQSAFLVRKAGPVLIETAVTYDELFQIYGFNGLWSRLRKLCHLKS